MPVEAHIKEHPAWFHRFGVSWTPSVVFLDPAGVEQYRIEGYLPKPEFRAQLEMALGRVAFQQKKWIDAETWYERVQRDFPQSPAAPEATYWAGVSRYQRSHDAQFLKDLNRTMAEKYPESVWTKKASIW